MKQKSGPREPPKWPVKVNPHLSSWHLGSTKVDQDDVSKVFVLAQNPMGLSLSTPLNQPTNLAGKHLTTGMVYWYQLPTGE
jgi:hypothetical protein